MDLVYSTKEKDSAVGRGWYKVLWNDGREGPILGVIAFYKSLRNSIYGPTCVFTINHGKNEV